MIEKVNSDKNESVLAFAGLERGIFAALETYSNVHRGSGHYSMVTTQLYDKAREIVLDYLGLKKSKYVVIFCTPRRAEVLKAQLNPGSYRMVSGQSYGLPFGVRALAVERKALPGRVPFLTGGGTARLIAPGWAILARAPDKFEAGTPAIINTIALARALQLTRHFGKEAFLNNPAEKATALDILYRDEWDKCSGHELLEKLRITLIGRYIPIPTAQGARTFINLDNAASTPALSLAWKAFNMAYRQTGQVQQEIIQEVRSICSGFLSAPLTDYEVIFTSNTTESINMAAESLSKETGHDSEPVVLSTLLEHNSNELPWRTISGVTIERLNVNEEGFFDPDEMEKVLAAYNQKNLHGKKRIRLVAVCGASNVLGTFNDLAEISRTVHRHGARLLVDAAQLAAHRRICMEQWGIDYLAFSAHKIYAPFGTGVLIVRKGLLQFSADEMDLIRSSGEENTGGIAALGKVLILLQRIGLDLISEEEQALTGRLLRGLAQIQGLTVYGIKDPESPGFERKGGVIAFTLKNLMSNRVAGELAMQGGIGVRYGCHCAHLLVKHILHVPPALVRFQRLIVTLAPWLQLPGVVRVSVGIQNTEDDVKAMLEALDKIARAQQNSRQQRFATTEEIPVYSRKEIKQQMKEFTGAAVQKVYG